MMIKTSRQLKDLIRNLSKGNSGKAQFLLRNYVMERFLERMSISQYKDSFILKGGVLVAAMVGLDMRMTMVRSILNTRLRDFYDVYILQSKGPQIDHNVLSDAIRATCKKRGSEDTLLIYQNILDQIERSTSMRELWKIYQTKNSYADGITWESVIFSIRFLCDSCIYVRAENHHTKSWTPA